ncbi:MAG TPA: single-stranded-DNA-specific exonuclease RecJ, partial [Phycisphaerae bacterium]|nr:single-stranded-DNA-specific exonuclease RecJ [Phycisphaerae bacterium]
ALFILLFSLHAETLTADPLSRTSVVQSTPSHQRSRMICPPHTSLTSYRKKKWVLPEQDASQVEHLANQLRLPPLITRILLHRGLSTPEAAAAFLDPKFKDLHSPWLLPNMHAAADRILQAVRQNEKITLYGDYDVDGITGTTMLWHTLKQAGADVHYYIPHRVDEGYGLNPDAVRSIIQSGTTLLITIDCGCSAIAPITLARQLGADVIVSDHHEFAGNGELPPANAIVHPRLTTDPTPHTPYPNPDLCGAGVAFKLAWATSQKICGTEKVSEQYRHLLMEFTALTALGTIADVVPLTGENRIIVRHGLTQLLRTQNPGLRALIDAAGYANGERKIDCTAVGFALAPRLNAAGRMGHANEAVELLTTATPDRAEEIAQYLESQNRQRQSTERKMLEIAKQQIENRNSKIENQDNVLVVSHESFHVGVVGIVASRLVDLYYRPTFVLAHSAGETSLELHGSARSISGFELHRAIEHVRDLLITGGGHAMAGGVKLPLANLDAFRDRLNTFAAERLNEDLLTPALNLDGLLTLDDCRTDIIAHLEKLEPFGRGNPTPRFLVQNVKLSAPPRRVGATGAHLQLTIAKGSRAARCIAFKMGELEPQLPVGTELHLVVEPKIDTFNGNARVDLVVCDIARCDGEPLNASPSIPLAHQPSA